MLIWYADWQEMCTEQQVSVDEAASHWLISAESMTHQLRAFTKNTIFFNLLSICPVSRIEVDAGVFSNELSSSGLKRAIQWVHEGCVWIYGQSLFMSDAKADPVQGAVTESAKPIGDFLFTHPAVSLGSLEYAVLNPGDSLFDEAVQACPSKATTLLARRRVFHWEGHHLWVSEVFFDAFFKAIEQDSCIA